MYPCKISLGILRFVNASADLAVKTKVGHLGKDFKLEF